MPYIIKKHVRMPHRDATSHKGENGRCLIVGGSDDYPGAMALAAMGCMRSGTDYVTAFTPTRVAWTLHSLMPELVTIKARGSRLSRLHLRRLKRQLPGVNAVLVGNGIGKESQGFARAVIEEATKQECPLIIDGDAIGSIPLQRLRSCVLTPHQGEFERLLRLSCIDPDSTVERIQQQMHEKTAIARTGHTDLILTADRQWYNRTGNAGMTTAGTGDVLAGFCAGLVSQGLSPEQAAINATYCIGRAGDQLYKKKGHAFIASDIGAQLEGGRNTE